jgi:hypothetical protein
MLLVSRAFGGVKTGTAYGIRARPFNSAQGRLFAQYAKDEAPTASVVAAAVGGPPACHDASITKRGIFHYIYAVLHQREYRLRYAANLRRKLPRILFIGLSS